MQETIYKLECLMKHNEDVIDKSLFNNIMYVIEGLHLLRPHEEAESIEGFRELGVWLEMGKTAGQMPFTLSKHMEIHVQRYLATSRTNPCP